MMSPVLSIIVPIYNVEKYISYFLDSLLFQIQKDIEVVFINDGSTDSSLEILNKKVNDYKNENLIVYNQENKGVSEARNSGLLISKGEYVTFVDPDDTVSDDYIETIMGDIITGKDIYIYNARRMKEDGELQEIIHVHSDGNDSNKSIFSEFKNGYWFLWSRVFKKKLFNQMSFPEGQRYEDLILVPKLTIKANSNEYRNKSIVNYRSSSNSITRVPDVDDVNTLVMACEDINSDDNHSLRVDGNYLKELYFITLIKTLIFVSVKVYGYRKSYALLKKVKKDTWPKVRTGRFVGVKNLMIIKYTLVYYFIHFAKRY